MKKNRRDLQGAIALVAVGTLFLLNNLTTIKLARYWPVILIAIGLSMLFSPRDES